jgi:hypothetical protein
MGFSTEGGDGGGENLSAGRACAACGATPRRGDARFCETCGRGLGEDYFPTGFLRASYSFEGGGTPAPTARATETAAPRPRVPRRPARPRVEFMSTKPENGAAATGMAFVTYALVPYLGILFCPGALLLGGLGLWRASRTPHAGGRRAAYTSIGLGLVIFCAQLVLWWVLYKVPEWSQQNM